MSTKTLYIVSRKCLFSGKITEICAFFGLTGQIFSGFSMKNSKILFPFLQQCDITL